MSTLEPRDSQWAAIRDADRHVLVVAGAGTGKTFTVVQRVLYALGVPVRGETYPHPIDLEQVAAITFTNQAAKELKEDLRSALREHGRRAAAYRVDEARIGTIHGFCGDILRESALRRGRAPLATVLEESETLARAAEAAREVLVDSIEDRSVPGLDALLGAWDTGRIDRWAVALMRKPDLLARLRREPAGLDAREVALVEIAARALERHGERLERDGAIDFDRMILWTRDLLRDDAAALRSLRRRLRLLIIDEFQDVDPGQKQIAWALAGMDSGGGSGGGGVRGGGSGSGGSGSGGSGSGGSGSGGSGSGGSGSGGSGGSGSDGVRLMLVGDPKQSIYRFRNADVTVWNEVQREFERSDGAHGFHVLEENFRSVPAILEFVDASVGKILGEPEEPHAPYEVEYRPVTATRDGGDAPNGVEFIVVPPGDNGRARKADEIRHMEARAVARRARELHDVEQREWRDMALLLAAWGPEPIFTAALRAEGVPVYVLRDEGFYDQREVLDLVLALETVRDPGDDRALLGYLRSPFVGLRDESLLSIARQVTSPYWRRLHTVELPAQEETDRLMRAVAVIWKYLELRDRMPAADLLDALMRETGFLAHLALQGDDGRQAIANVRRFLAMARESNGAGTGELLRSIRESRDRKDRVAQARLYAASENVMLITSIHVAKGLEWPVVFWGDAAGGGAGINDKLLIGRDTIRLGTPDLEPKDEAEDWVTLRDGLKAEMDAERKRIWYVAGTRARDRLIISGVPRGGTRASTLARELVGLFPGLESAERVGVAGFEAAVLTAGTTAGDEGRGTRGGRRGAGDEGRATDGGSDGGRREAGLAVPFAPIETAEGLLRHSATELLAHGRCARRHWLKYTVGIGEPAWGGSRDQLITAVARGQIVHDVLEHEGEAELADLLEAAIGRWDEDAPAPESERGMRYRAHLGDEVARVLEHPEYAELAHRAGARRELSFLRVREDGSAIQGFIDLAVPAADGEGFELLDVKTTQCSAGQAPEIASHYGPQRDVYVTAAEAISGRPVERFAFQFSRARVQIGEPLDPAEREEAARRVDERIAEIEAGGAPLTEHPAECGFCGYRRVGLCAGVPSGPPAARDIEPVLARIRKDRFRRSFRMGEAELAELHGKGLDVMLEHARGFVDTRLAAARPANDGKQTPWRGHPVFVAQHATATCCRKCMEKWHGIRRGAELTDEERAYIVRVIGRWLEVQGGIAAAAGPRSGQLGLL